MSGDTIVKKNGLVWIDQASAALGSVAEASDFVFAKGKLIAHCRANDIPHVAIDGFADALALLPRLLAGTLGVPDVTATLPSAALA